MSATLTAETPVTSGKGIVTFKSTTKNDTTGLVPQAKTIVDIVREAGTISKKDLIAKLSERLQTRQPAGRVLSFYKAKLVQDGYVSVTKA